jgi:hypothetical protein
MQNIHYQRSDSGCGTSSPLSIFIVRKGETMVYSNKEAVSICVKCSNAFFTKFFLLGKSNALRNKISGFQQLTDETIAEV